MIQYDLFSTPVWIDEYDQSHPALNEMLIEDGRNYSALIDSGKLPDYNSPAFNNSFLEFPGYGTQTLLELVKQKVAEIAQLRNWPKHAIEMRSLLNYIQPNECDSPHHHPDCDLIAVYYVKVPTRSGDLLLHDTRGSVKALWQDPLVKNDASGKSGRVFYRFVPKAGNLIICPSYVFHSVETNLSDQSRISVVMNIRINIDPSYDDWRPLSKKPNAVY